MFHPDPMVHYEPRAREAPFENVYFNTIDGQELNGWLFMRQNDAPILLLCHGNGGNISYWLDHSLQLFNLGVNVFMFDYRGYGRSSGKPSEKGIYVDGLAAYDFLVQKKGFSGQAIIPYGISLGGAVAVEIARQRPVRSLVLEAAFTSSKEMAKQIPLFYFFSPLLPAHYNNMAKIEQIDAPKLLIHGEADEIVPFNMGERLFETAREPKYFYTVKQAGHNDINLHGGKAYYMVLFRFIKDSRI